MSSPNAAGATQLSALATFGRELTVRWHALAARERRLIAVAAAVVVAALLWRVTVAPALRTMREAPVEIDRLDTELLRMRALAAEAATLRDAAPVTASQASAALTAASARLGSSARLVLQGERATLQLTGVDGPALQAWLAEVRSAARARPVEMQVSRGAQGLSGTLVVAFGAPG